MEQDDATTPRGEEKEFKLPNALSLDLSKEAMTDKRPHPTRSNATNGQKAQTPQNGPVLGSLADALKRLKPHSNRPSSSSSIPMNPTTDDESYDADPEKESAFGDDEEDGVLSPAAAAKRANNLPLPSLTARNLSHQNGRTNGHAKNQSGDSEATVNEEQNARHPSFPAEHRSHASSATSSVFPGKGFMRSTSVNSGRSTFASSRPHPTPGVRREQPSYFEFKSVEEKRLDEDTARTKYWKRFGPYLSERQWATVREDYSANGDAWSHFPHDQARSRAYRWGEDGIAGFSDSKCRLAFAVGLWNEKDPILKERMFGVTGHQGNHGEDVKELYYYLDNTPTHSYMKYLYKYPQREYPYARLVEESQQRSREVVEFEITDTDAFDDDAYWDVFVEYAKDPEDPEGISIRITAYNRGPEEANLHIVPNLWFRNTWSWPKEKPKGKKMPKMSNPKENVVQADHETLGRFFWHACESPAPVGPRKSREPVPETEGTVAPTLLFTENDTNLERLYGVPNKSPFVKDAFHDHIIERHRPGWVDPAVLKSRAEEKARAEAEKAARAKENGEELTNGSPHDEPLSPEDATPHPERQYVNPEKKGTKVGAHYVFEKVPPRGGCAVVRLRLSRNEDDEMAVDEELFDQTIEDRRLDADEFYARFNSHVLTDDLRNIMRQALSGMLWNKQFYYFVQDEWLKGDPGQPPPPPERQFVRNRDWRHLYIDNIISMPDKWEYPWFATWDLAFHTIPLAMVDPAFAKHQLDVLTREWFMRPDGALPAYEWDFGDVNPPVHAWATFRVFKLERKTYGRADFPFLEKVFQKLLINFTWWTNRMDPSGLGVFKGGFLGLDNIGIFNRSAEVPMGGDLHQADATSWMAFYSLQMCAFPAHTHILNKIRLNIALELAKNNPVYEDIASKFYEHFIFIADSMSYSPNDPNLSLWDEKDGFYYDTVDLGNGQSIPIRIRSLVGLMPLFGTLTIEPGTLQRFPSFKKRLDWFLANRPELSQRNIASMSKPGKAERRLLAMVNKERLEKILHRMLNEDEFLSKFGIRSLSREYAKEPFSMEINGQHLTVPYWAGDSQSAMFGGNSNWRGPIWLATTALLIESLQRFHQYYGHDFQIECPTGSGDMMTLAGVADEIQHRLIHIFARDVNGERAYNGGSEKFNKDPHFRDNILFYEYFNGDNGRGLGASHQCGWTGWIAYAIWQTGHNARLPRTPRTPRSTAAHYFDETVPPTPALSDEGEKFLGAFSDGGETELEPDELVRLTPFRKID